MKTKKENKTQRFELRISPSKKALLQEIARQRNTKVTSLLSQAIDDLTGRELARATKEDFLHIQYSFRSELGEINGQRYITSYFADVFVEDDYGNPGAQVGRFQVKLIHLGLAMNNSYDVQEIFDSEEGTFQIGEEIYDFEAGEFHPAIIEFYKYLDGHDVCLISNFEMLPETRKLGIDKKVTKDIVNRFSGGCGLFVAECALVETQSLYEGIGFDHIKGFESLRFLDPSTINLKLDDVNLQ